MNNYILQIDTATETCSVSISSDGQVVGQIDAVEPNLHASKLTVFIDQLLQDLQLTYANLKAVAVSMGPGSYTGLRIGVSTAKGLCYALDIPLLAVNTLESIYEGYVKSKEVKANDIFIPMLDARRMEVYMAVYNGKGDLVEPTKAEIIDSDSFVRFVDYQVYIFGSGAGKLADTFAEHSHIHIDQTYKHSSAWMTKVAYEKFNEQAFEDLIYFEPFYLKEFVATTPKKLV